MKKLSKAEARIARKIEKLASNEGKSARLDKCIEIKDKYLKSAVTPPLSNSPRAHLPESYKKYYFTWCDTHSDVSGDWSWSEPRQWDDNEYAQTIKPHMDSHNSDSWNDVENKTYSGKKKYRKLLNKYQPLDSLCNEALVRWHDLEHISEFEELFRLRLGDKKRIWGIRIQHHFYMVWYERNHKICPVKD